MMFSKKREEVRFEFLTAVKKSVLFFWTVTLYGLVSRHKCFFKVFELTYESAWSHNPEQQRQSERDFTI
jgi:hypothetical protein